MADSKNTFKTVSGFDVKIEGINPNHFSSVSGAGIMVEDHATKSQDGKEVVNTAGSYNAKDITLVRKFTGDKSLYDWMERVKAQGSAPNLRPGSIILKDSEGKAIATFELEACWIKDWTGPMVSKEVHGGGLLNETAVISVGNVKWR